MPLDTSADAELALLLKPLWKVIPCLFIHYVVHGSTFSLGMEVLSSLLKWLAITEKQNMTHLVHTIIIWIPVYRLGYQI